MNWKTVLLFNRSAFILTFKANVRWFASQRRIVLGIESSCDDTCCAIVSVDGQERPSILADCRHCESRKHINFGGIIPNVARIMHADAIERVVSNALKIGGIDMNLVDAIGVSNRPGLPHCLTVGTEYAKRLSIEYKKPFIPIHHMEAHALVAMMNNDHLKFPFLTLLISGGHCQLVLVNDLEEFILLGETKDNSPGEVLDKTARALKVRNLGEPFDTVSGGRAIELLSQYGNPTAFFQNIIDPVKAVNNCNFSFSGIKSSILSKIKELEIQSDLPVDCPIPQIADIAASVQHVFAIYLFARLRNAVKFIEKSNILHIPDKLSASCDVMDFSIERKPLNLQVVISGGVACNQYITRTIKELSETSRYYFDDTQVEVITPEAKLCNDNGVMIAWNAALKLLHGSSDVLVTEEQIFEVGIHPKAPHLNAVSDRIEKRSKSI